MLILMQS